MIKVGVMGCCGRMGKAIVDLIDDDPILVLQCAWENEKHPQLGKSIGKDSIRIDVFPSGLPDVDVVIDFTYPDVTLRLVEELEVVNKPVVIGTTGLSKDILDKIDKLSQKVSVVLSPNMSLGVNLLFVLVQMATSILPDEYEIEIIEAHHHYKKDAPSGTAMKIWEIIKKVRSLKDEDLVFGRKGFVGQRRVDEVGMHAIRCADIIGEHTVMFGIEGERIELVHKASSRYAFARGAILATKFVVEKSCGIYDMMDVMGLKSITF